MGEHHHCVKIISWSAIITGGLVGLGLGFLLNLFSIGIGLTAFSTAADGVTAFAIGGFLGFLIGGIVSMFVAGWVAGYMGRPYALHPNAGVLYGFGAWVIALILGILMAVPSAKFLASSTAYVTNHNTMVVRYADSAYVTPPTATTVDSEKAAADMAKTAFALFILFFLGAVSSSVGGYYGMMYHREELNSMVDAHRSDRPRV